MAKPNLQLAVPFFGVTDMEKSLDFYLKGLGFTIRNQWTPRGKIEWCWLSRDEVSLMLQEPRLKTHAIHASDQKKGFGITICIQCEDALALYHEFRDRQLQVTEPFVGNNMWVISVDDPDGYHLEFESATDVPEETKYSELGAAEGNRDSELGAAGGNRDSELGAAEGNRDSKLGVAGGNRDSDVSSPETPLSL